MVLWGKGRTRSELEPKLTKNILLTFSHIRKHAVGKTVVSNVVFEF